MMEKEDGKLEQYFCEICNMEITGKSQWDQHNLSRNHLKKAANISEFELNERDMFIDVTNEAYKTVITATKSQLSGCEYIIYDRETCETKCLVCRVLLKADGATIMDHVKSPKHVHVFFKAHYPKFFDEIQKTSKNRTELQGSVAKYADLLLHKSGGKKEPRVHQKGYYDALSQVQKQEVDSILAVKQIQLEEEKKRELKDFKPERILPTRSPPRRSSPRPSPHRRSPSRRSRSRSPSRHHRRHRSTSREKRSFSRERSKRRSRSPVSRRGGDSKTHYISSPHKGRSPPPFQRNRERQNMTDKAFERAYMNLTGGFGGGRFPSPRDTVLDRSFERERYGERSGLPPPDRIIPPRTWNEREGQQPPRPHSPRSRTKDAEKYPDTKNRDYIETYLPDTHSSSSKSIRPQEMEYLPTDPDIFGVLCTSELTKFGPGERAYVQDLIDALPGAVIGIEYIAEYSDPRGVYEPGYLCTLCQYRLNPAQCVQHLVSEKHSMEYLKKHYERQYMALCIGTLGEEVRTQMKRRYLAEIEAEEHGRLVSQKIVLQNDSRQVFLHHKRAPGRPIDLAPQSDYGRGSGDPGGNYRDRREIEVSKPSFTYSERAAKAKELAELERTLPPFCQRNLEQGWYSIRSKSIDYYRRLALSRNPNALYFSIRDPYGKESFYGDWNPQLMRRLQDKFNFKLDHINWLQQLLTDWKIPCYVPLQSADLRPLEQEVELAVLNELLEQILKPVSTLRYMQTFEYENYDKELEEEKMKSQLRPSNTHRSEAFLQHYEEYEDRKRTEKRTESPFEMDRRQGRGDEDYRQYREPEGSAESRRTKSPSLGFKIGLKSQAKPPLRSNADVAAKLAGPESDSDEEVKEEEEPEREESEMDKKLKTIIDSLLRIAKQDSQNKNPILQLLTEFRNARDILFRLATRQPSQLNQLVNVAKNPSLSVPTEVLNQLRKRLRDVEEEMLKQREEEAAKRKKEEEEKKRSQTCVQTAKEEMRKIELKQRLEEELLKHSRTAESPASSHQLQVLTPKLPGIIATTQPATTAFNPVVTQAFVSQPSPPVRPRVSLSPPIGIQLHNQIGSAPQAYGVGFGMVPNTRMGMAMGMGLPPIGAQFGAGTGMVPQFMPMPGMVRPMGGGGPPMMGHQGMFGFNPMGPQQGFRQNMQRPMQGGSRPRPQSLLSGMFGGDVGPSTSQQRYLE